MNGHTVTDPACAYWHGRPSADRRPCLVCVPPAPATPVAAGDELVGRLLADLARATGRSLAVTRLSYGLEAPR